jgi:Ni,Fe-hydrogenase I cytochrome b subunit
MQRSFPTLLSLVVLALGGAYLSQPAAAQNAPVRATATCTQGTVTLTGDHCKINANNRCECWDN